MVSDYNTCMEIHDIIKTLVSCTHACNGSQQFTDQNKFDQNEICNSIADYEKMKGYGKPMLWIGLYIGVASLLCVLAMTADLIHVFRNKKLWFPSKYFTLNAATIMVITTAMKLPVDLNSPMPGWVDEYAKLVSLPFMSTMIVNLMLSLTSLTGKELFENVLGLLILLITIIVNVVIQIQTGVIENYVITYIYISLMLYLLILLISFALTTPVTKQILETKYQVARKRVSKNIHTNTFSVEDLIQSVRRYSIMAGTCSPQFVMATTPLCSAACIICIANTCTFFYHASNICIFYYHVLLKKEYDLKWVYLVLLEYKSDYKWSMLMIYIIQSVGVIVGTIAPLFRCFAPLNFKLSIKWCKRHTKIFKVERYWIQKLYDVKEIDIVFPIGSRRFKAHVHNLNHFIVHICTTFQRVIVVSCKIIALVPIGVVVIGVYCVHCWIFFKRVFFAKLLVSNRDTIQVVEPNDGVEDIQNYVLQLENEMQLATRTLKLIYKSVDRLIQKAEKQLPKNLLGLVERSTGFEGVLSFVSDEIQTLLSAELPNSWSLPIITLTSVAISLPNICKDVTDSLFNSVSEGLPYTFLVDENLNNTGEAKTTRKETRFLWHEVEVGHKNKWLGNALKKSYFRGKTPREILKWFSDKAEALIVDNNKHNNEEMINNNKYQLIAANSMYRITQTIMLQCIEDVTEEQLFTLLYDMIASIMVACLTNLPRVIEMKCHGRRLEQREVSVHAAAKILGKTKKIIERIQIYELPSVVPDEMALIDKWRVHLKQSTYHS